MNRGAFLGLVLAALVTFGAAVVYGRTELPATSSGPAESSASSGVSESILLTETAVPQIDVPAEDLFELASVDGGLSVLVDAAAKATLDPVKAIMNIYAEPKYGEAPLTVTFEDWSVTSDEEGPIVCWDWTFDVFDSDLDGDLEKGGGCGDEYRVVTHVYDQPGTYTVELTIRMRNSLPDGNARYWTRRYLNYVSVIGQAEEPTTASFSASSGIVDGTSLVPLNDWAPLMFFTMTYGEGNPAHRILETLSFSITCDRGPDRPWAWCECPRVEDLLEFALWRDNGDDGPDGVFEPIRGGAAYDELLDYGPIEWRWDNHGSPFATNIVEGQPIRYDLNFLRDVESFDEATRESSPISVPDQTWGYILTVRTSSIWRSGTMLGFILHGAHMIYYYWDGTKYIPKEIYAGDSYAPEKFSDIDKDMGYSGVFGVFDISGTHYQDYSYNHFDNNTWNWPAMIYTPGPDHVRPVWNKLDGVIENGIGEWLDLRRVSSLETWVPVIGINLHGALTNDLYGTPGMQPGELNIICTDIGGDPYGIPGNGGFDAQNGLEEFTQLGSRLNTPAIEWDYAFNGVWIYHDTNDNGVFDQPIVPGTGGVTFVDYPMRPLAWNYYWREDMEGLIQEGLLEWEYDPFPPGGGDPWWKGKLAFAGGRRRNPGEEPTGFAELIPDGSDSWSDLKCDYFVVVRADSGYEDSSTRDPDNVGVSMGGDTKVFVEPRRINPYTGFMDGGLRITGSLLNDFYGPVDQGEVFTPWQEDSRLNYPNDWEPWWTERTHNAVNTKPIRFGLDVHDLVLTYDSDNSYAKGSLLIIADPDFFYCGSYYGNFDQWMDPFNVIGNHFVYGDLAAGTTAYYQWDAPQWGRDSFWKFQYPFETIPFENPNLWDVRTRYYPNVPPQPTLPGYTTWPYRFQVDDGSGGVRHLLSGTGDQSTDVYVFDVPGETWPEDGFVGYWLIDHKGGTFYITGNSASRLELWQGHAVLDGDWVIAANALTRGRYPHVSNWPEGLDPAGLRAARLLKQHVDSNSIPDAINVTGITNGVAMLGLNLAGADDGWTNRLRTVMLLGVTVAFWGPTFDPWDDLLALDADGTLPASGVLLWEDRNSNGVFDAIAGDGIVPLKNCAWRQDPEFVDIDGDRNADDFDGDGEITDADKAWVLELVPSRPWVPPVKDANWGDDLFVVVRPSRKIERFEQFRAVVVSHMPERELPSQQEGGVSLSPVAYFADDSFIKNNPEESAVQDFYSHDMLEANVPCDVVNLTTPGQPVMPGGPPIAVLGIDASTNRPPAVSTHFTGNGTASGNMVTTTGKEWAGTGVVGDYLIGRSSQTGQIEGYKITGAAGQTLTLDGAAPPNGSLIATGKVIVVRDPTFLEQVIVELYDHNVDGGFNWKKDLKPLSMDGANSGIAIYRDNDWASGNRNGEFDPDIDIPVALDQVPVEIGVLGGATPIRFVFSSPGTDDSIRGGTMPLAEQPRRRQWIPDSFGISNNDVDYGPDFFVVIRPAQEMELGDDFRIGIVSWGPNTPTEPDPDQFPTHIEDAGTGATLFDLLSEFPWGSRALGFITLFKDKPKYNYWIYDQVQRKQIPHVEEDHSQDNNPYRYWVRSTANKYTQTNTLTSLAAPIVDFRANYTRRAPGQQIQFTSLSTGAITNYIWDFGDGQTVDGANSSVVNHSYAGPGFYDISLTVTDDQDATRTKTKHRYIEIVDLPYADFEGTPTEATMTPDNTGVLGATVNFTDLSVGTATNLPVGFGWDFGDGSSSTEQHPAHRYTTSGTYSVRLTTTFQDSDTDTYTRNDYIKIIEPDVEGGEGEGEGEGTEGEGEAPEEPTTSIAIEEGIKDRNTHALLPLMDWMPLFTIRMTWDSEDSPAPRILESLYYTIRQDPRDIDDLNYDSLSGPDVSDILEFALFEEFGDDDEIDGVLDYRDYPVYYWNNMGYPLGELVSQSPGNLVYHLDFVGTGTPEQPQFPLREGPPDPGRSYIVAVRTSATWRSGLTLSYTVDYARMYPFPVNEDGEPSDKYSPNFYDDENLDEDVGYSSAFAAYDITNGPLPGNEAFYVNAWTWPCVLNTPMAEHSRPRWDAPGQMFNFMTGEWSQARTLLPLEQWVSVIGINIHSAGARSLADSTHSHWLVDDVPYAVLQEVNVVVTDVGGDPLGEPGNGGLYAPEAFDPMVGWMDSVIVDEAIGKDHAFNGVSVWHDTNDNGVFDRPTPLPAGGAKLVDLPMWPGYEYVFSSETGYFSDVPTWEYVPFPPGGGDPWWKIKLSLWGWNRSADGAEGAIQHTPDGAWQDQYKPDYFVVVRADSGFEDISLTAPDGTGMKRGADFRAFIEPRRYNEVSGHWDGGIYADSQIPAQGSEYFGTWQDDERWGEDEPWWPQRTQIAENTKTVRASFDVHDLVSTYQSNNNYAQRVYLHYGTGGFYVYVDWDEDTMPGANYGFLGGYTTYFDYWMDPFGLRQGQFYNRHSVGVVDWNVWLHVAIQDDYGIYVDDETGSTHFPYETAPFFNPTFDALPHGPRSPLYATPPAQPSLPGHMTWPATITPGQYPRASDWSYEDRKARILKQHVDIFSVPTAMLGFNLCGADDPITNRASRVKLDRITVAFWGPDFNPSKLMPLDPDGLDPQSGVMLYQDTNNDGMFMWTDITGAITYFGMDTALGLDGLQWSGAPEAIDLDGDEQPDDMNGDGHVDTADHAWVLSLMPKQDWALPIRDVASAFNWLDDDEGGDEKSAARAGVSRPRPEAKPLLLNGEESPLATAAPTKASSEDNAGDDLFLVVRTSDQLAALEGFRVVVPATLPDRTVDRLAGVQLLPNQPVPPSQRALSANVKFNPEEGPVQDFFGHDMLESNVPAKVVDLTARPQTIARGGSVIPIMGLDVSTNRPETTVDSGTSATTGENSFSVASANWEPGAFVNCWLIDSKYEAYLIMGNTRNQLTLLSGTPRDGSWRIVKNPTFLEQVVVEFYGEVGDAVAEGEGEEGEGEGTLPVSRFNLSQHLLPLDRDAKISGVGLYRDNDNDPRNNNGTFDPDIDLPVLLDAPPMLVGVAGEPDTQVKFIFSSPGTDDWPVPMAQQPRRRQWVPESFGNMSNARDMGPDFFVVARASSRMPQDTTFTAAIVGWGPNTPTEPDPDTFILPQSPGIPNDHFELFSEFPWGSRALGFVTLYKDAPAYYYMDGAQARRDIDTSAGFVRTGTSVKKRTGVITAKDSLLGPYSVVVDSVTQSQLPATISSQDGFSFVINGQGFGSSAVVALTGYDLTVTQCTETTINCTIRNKGDGTSPAMPVVLIVRNPGSNEECSRDDLFTLTGAAPGTAPTITGVSPSRGTQNDFPIRINGANFNQRGDIEVLLGRTMVPVQSVSADGKSVIVSYPFAGLPQPGPLDVVVRNLQPNSTKAAEAVLISGFTFVNQPMRPCFIATAAYGTPLDCHLDTFRSFRDDVLLKTRGGAAFVAWYYRHSPAAAEFIAGRPLLAAAVRVVLTPVAWVLENTAAVVMAVTMLTAYAAFVRRKRISAGSVRGR